MRSFIGIQQPEKVDYKLKGENVDSSLRKLDSQGINPTELWFLKGSRII